jgi:hypothetical protein
MGPIADKLRNFAVYSRWSNMTMKVSVTGMSWYRREDYPRILQIMLDAHKLPRTFDDWKGKPRAAKKK